MQSHTHAIATEVLAVRTQYRFDIRAIHEKWSAFGDFQAGYPKVSAGFAQRIKLPRESKDETS